MSNLEGGDALPLGPAFRDGSGPGALPIPPAREGPDPGDAEDSEWVRRFQAGKEDGFNRLVLKHKDRIFGLCLRMLSGDRDDAEDAAQESFVKVYRGMAGFRMEAKFSSWLYRIAVNTCKNKLASAPHKRGKLHRPLDAAETDSAPSSPSPAQELAAKGKRRAIEAAIAKLPEEQRILVILRDIEGRSYEEIAEATGLNPGTLKSRLNRGRRQLQEWLRDCFLMAILAAIGSGA